MEEPEGCPAPEELEEEEAREDEEEDGIMPPDDVFSSAAAEAREEGDSEERKCQECGERSHNTEFFKAFQISVCNQCKWDAPAYKCMTKTEAKETFLLTDADLDPGRGGLAFVVRSNPRKERWNQMKLYLRQQVEQKSHERFGGPDGLEAEIRHRVMEQYARKRKKLEGKLPKKKTRTAGIKPRAKSPERHTHRWGEEVQVGDSDDWTKTCVECGAVDCFMKL
mmetsp:Transcript_34712/g.79174  ORF Transcript_34712/g.79174 Transcript_34712/m.79174 type:complete len:223 (+) Transcript_34712:3-671(+)